MIVLFSLAQSLQSMEQLTTSEDELLLKLPDDSELESAGMSKLSTPAAMV